MMTRHLLEFLLQRRSVKPDMLRPPGPGPDDLELILRAASRVPDHKKLVPWRFMIFDGDARVKAGEIFAEACRAEETSPPSPARLDMERQRFLRAPLVLGVISKATPKPGAPEWEQHLSAGAACFNACLAANSLGYATAWITEWIAYSATVRAGLGLQEHERVAGFIYIGTSDTRPADRERPVLADIVTHWGR
jgi:nitroreductase